MEVTEPRRYCLWGAGCRPGSGLAYRLDAKEAVAVAIDKGKNPIPVAADGNPFYPPTAAWYDLGTVDLARGKHVITWYLGGLTEKIRGRHGLFPAHHRHVHAERQVQARRDVAGAHPRFPAGPGVEIVPETDKLDPSAVL